MQNFQGIVFMGTQIYREVFKSTLRVPLIRRQSESYITISNHSMPFCFISPEVINIQRREVELDIILPRVNNFDIKNRNRIFVLLNANNTKQELGR